MKLFSRTVHMAGTPADTFAFASGMRQFVSDTIGREVALWGANFGAPVGTMIYALPVEGLADLQSLQQQLMENPAYHERIAEGQQFAGAIPPEDALGNVIHGQLGEERPPVGFVASMTTATIANGKYADAIAWSVDMAQRAESITGTPVMFIANQFGPYGSVGWLSIVPDMATADANNDAINADAEWMKQLGDVGELFAEGSGNQMLATRLA